MSEWRGRHPPAQEISTMLAGRIEQLCREILPLGKAVGAHWIDAKRSAGGLGDSMKVRIGADGTGTWKHFGASGENRGDALSLVAYCVTGGDTRQAYQWAVRWLGLAEASPEEMSRRRVAAAAAAERQKQKAEKSRAGRVNWALEIWKRSMDIIGTPADLYLQGRGIRLAELSRVPSVLRFHPGIRHQDCPPDELFPAMIAMVTGGDGRFAGIHRTYLEVRRDGTVGRPALDNTKLSLGRIRGGAIRLWRGGSNLPLGTCPDGELVMLVEGIEDGLSVVQAMPETRTLVGISLSLMAEVELPPAVRTVLIGRERDTHPDAIAGAENCMAAHRRAGRLVREVWPPNGAKDLNEALTNPNRSNRPKDLLT